jgi:lipopolysaccharide transport system ATP-binding protein
MEIGPVKQVLCRLHEVLLIPGKYRMNVAIRARGELQDHVEAAATFVVLPGQIRGRPISGSAAWGHVVMPHQWVAQQLAEGSLSDVT